MKQKSIIFASIFTALVLLHAPLLRLPYFWDEAGYYIPAARDFLLSGTLIPQSTLSNAHPPLPAIYLAAWWKIFGYAPVVTRLAALFAAAFGILQTYLLARRLTQTPVAIWTTLLTALYPVVFAQSSLAHADIAAFALTMWGLQSYFDPDSPSWKAPAIFALAALAKETAIVTPFALALVETPEWLAGRLGLYFHLAISSSENRLFARVRCGFYFVFSALPLCLWYAYHYARTGHVFGNPEFFRYNVGATITPLRFLLAFVQRLWHVFGHMNMWLLSLLMLIAMFLPARKESPTTQKERPRIPIAIQLSLFAVVLGHLVLFSLLGGALLTRYLLPCFPIVILIFVNTLWRRMPRWQCATTAVGVFVVAWFVNPPYRFAPEDNLTYASYVRLHQHAAQYLTLHHPNGHILTAWPASDELTLPYLGYVSQPIAVVRIENFSREQVTLAGRNAEYDIVLAFSTKYEPRRRLFRWKFWEQSHERYFDYHQDLPPEIIARMLGGKTVYQEAQRGEWVAVIEIERPAYLAKR
jgi:hypothetical protein